MRCSNAKDAACIRSFIARQSAVTGLSVFLESDAGGRCLELLEIAANEGDLQILFAIADYRRAIDGWNADFIRKAAG